MAMPPTFAGFRRASIAMPADPMRKPAEVRRFRYVAVFSGVEQRESAIGGVGGARNVSKSRAGARTARRGAPRVAPVGAGIPPTGFMTLVEGEPILATNAFSPAKASPSEKDFG